MKTRNPNANCGNCPYWKHIKDGIGHCRPKPASECGSWQETDVGEWCGRHPNFWLEETDLSAVTGAYPDLPDLERHDPNEAKIQEAARLINNGEHAEALKVLREMHGLVNRFVCSECGHISSRTDPGFACRECGSGIVRIRVVPDPGVLAMQALAETDGRKEAENENEKRIRSNRTG